ncbi:sodium channel protein Nach [Anastrepha ludens]|uniref:sodium channel protein Nach n=1 Tax=Anastrepha ludens TaxID=28586 RepID=UPI0023AFBA21|nr:sodium channel protein Nach [Anastrepha ludens]
MAHLKLKPKKTGRSVSPLYAAFRRTWLAFCSSTSIHGLKYIQDRDTNKLVRFIWMLITLLMFICAIVMVITFYLDYRSNPTRMNIATDNAPVESLTFPAVTICPEALHNVQRIKVYLETLQLPPGFNITQIIVALSISNGFISDNNSPSKDDIDLLEKLMQINNISMLAFMENVHWKCDQFLIRCRFQMQIVECEKLFQASRTFFGYCCSFNLNQYGMNYTGAKSRAGVIEGLSLVLYYNDSNFHEIRSNSNGFKVMVSENDAFPSAHSILKFASPKQETFVGIRPVETYCSRNVKKLSVEERQCVLPYEFPLKYFRKYMDTNCELEFRVRNMLEMCGCLTYFFYTNRTNDRICSFKDIPCLVDNFASIIGRYKANQSFCPNSCELIEINAELSSSEFNIDIPTVGDFYSGIQENYTVVHIFLNNQVYRRVRRDLLSNMVALVSNLGSAFSLFAGISMVSIVEIIYYLTVILRKHYKEEVKARLKLRT